ncbi:MAG: hypothetical protein K2H66_04425 [Oscillospiraceae bacterium]|nr:hypothetical protein [Oscillospiraceae bacterium]
MTENTKCETSIVSIEAAIAVVSRKYDLDEKDLLEIFEALDCITPEQKAETITTCTSFAKDMFDSKVMGK